jgi:transcriptional regulator with XRE-family HTH domain
MKRYAVEALALLSNLIKSRRIEGQMTMNELAFRAGISTDILERIEQADSACPIGFYFAVAEELRIHLFEDGQTRLTWRLFNVQEKIALLPKVDIQMRTQVKNDF